MSIDVAASETVTISRSGSAIDVNGGQCGLADVTNTGQVNVATDANSSVVLDLEGGPFAPGTSTTDDDPEIKFDIEGALYFFAMQVIGTAGDDHIAGGESSYDVLNLDSSEATPDADVTLIHPSSIDIQGLGGNDDLWLGGGPKVGPGTDYPFGTVTGMVTLEGGDGDDTVSCAVGDTVTLSGDAGTDTVDCSWLPAPDRLALGLAQHLSFGGGPETTLNSIEAAIGGAGADFMSAGASNDRLVGGPGDDVMRGGGGSDRLVGSGGADTVRGSSANDTLLGEGGPDLLHGGGGMDVCRGGPGRDILHTCE